MVVNVVFVLVNVALNKVPPPLVAHFTISGIARAPVSESPGTVATPPHRR